MQSSIYKWFFIREDTSTISRPTLHFYIIKKGPSLQSTETLNYVMLKVSEAVES